MHFYSHTYAETLALPLKTFWLMNRNIDRILAQKDMRSLLVANRSQAPAEEATAFQRQLVIEAGTIVKLEADNPLHAKRDEAGFAELKRMAQQM